MHMSVTDSSRELYFDLLKRSLLDEIHSDDPLAHYVMYREKRDDFGPIGDADDTDPGIAAKIAAFADKSLQRAVEYLQAKLAERR